METTYHTEIPWLGLRLDDDFGSNRALPVTHQAQVPTQRPLQAFLGPGQRNPPGETLGSSISPWPENSDQGSMACHGNHGLPYSPFGCDTATQQRPVSLFPGRCRPVPLSSHAIPKHTSASRISDMLDMSDIGTEWLLSLQTTQIRPEKQPTFDVQIRPETHPGIVWKPCLLLGICSMNKVTFTYVHILKLQWSSPKSQSVGNRRKFGS